MKEIPLTRGKTAIIDDDDYEKVIKFKWHALPNHNTFYAYRSIYIDGRVTKQSMHNLIAGYNKTDHIDGNGLNNQKENLRQCNDSSNGANQRKSSLKSYSSKYKGVSWHKLRGKWIARITKNYKLINIGYFSSEIEAALAYDRKALELFGEHARLNFPSGGSS